MKFVDMDINGKREILSRVVAMQGTNSSVVEKDWWVTTVLRSLFSLPYSSSLSFKGGTSLSKCWKMINRMSEDIDIAIDREYLGFGGTLSKNQISDRLRRAACTFVREKMQFDIADALIKDGIPENAFDVHVNITPISTTDPERIEIAYQSVIEENPYIRPRVIIEISGRSMNEPVRNVEIASMIDISFPSAPFVEPLFPVRAVLPERTFLEKLFLLHEEFAKQENLIRAERMSRHLYDVGQMAEQGVADRALSDDALYRSVIEHRRTFIGLKGFDYDTLNPDRISFVPPSNVLPIWRADYNFMRENMIYKDSPSFDELITRIEALNKRVRQMADK